MFSPLGDPEAIEDLARSFGRRAEDLAALGSRLRRRADDARWTANKADAYRHRMAARQRRLEQIADEFRSLSQELRRLAAEVRAELQFLAGLERRVRDALGNFRPAPGVSPPLHGTPWSEVNLPKPGDPAWRQVAGAMGLR